jgi:hypothetical protein
VIVPLTHGWSVFSPFIALALIGALAMILRWTFRQDPAEPQELFEPPQAEAEGLFEGDEPAAEDYGLLGVAAVVETTDAAEQIRAVLADAGIRATIAGTKDGRVQVLVFETEVPRARRVVGWPV